VKTILGTNTLWRQAVVMINRLCRLGPACPAEVALHAWPTPSEVIAAGTQYLRDDVRAGYRARYIIALAEQVESGQLDLDVLDARAPALSSHELFRLLLSLPGVGKSSAHFLMNLLGHYDHISIDSATYAYATRALFRGKRPSEQQIRRRFARFGKWQSLVYWFTRWTPRLAWWEDAAGRAGS
jgi:N-glycosylase/DNA lyase